MGDGGDGLPRRDVLPADQDTACICLDSQLFCVGQSRHLHGVERDLLISVLRVAIQHKFHGNIPPIIFVKRHLAHELTGNFAHLHPHLQKEIE